jgi:hypothetical protein
MPHMGTTTIAGGATVQAVVPAQDSSAASQLQGVVQALQALAASMAALGSGAGAAIGAGALGGGTALRAAVSTVTTGGGADAHAKMNMSLPTPPPEGDPRFLDGSTGPTVKKGKAETLDIPDGKGFGGAKGRKQNDDDKSKYNYSVTDANFSNQLGLLAKDPDTGKPMNYVQHIQTYAAANYIEAYNHPLYEKLIANQNAGKGTILGASAYLMGLTKTADPALEGITQAEIAQIPAQIPGTPMDARAYVASGKDITGQDWARPHHAGSQFKALSGLIEAGVGWQDAMVLAGDDGISGAGRLNGVNGQDGKDGFNDGEEEIFAKGALLQQQTGINVVQLMMGGHNHLGGDPSALTNPNINRILRKTDPTIAKDDRTSSAARAQDIYQAIVDGKVSDLDKADAKGTQATNKKLLAKATGGATAIQASALTQARTATQQLAA